MLELDAKTVTPAVAKDPQPFGMRFLWVMPDYTGNLSVPINPDEVDRETFDKLLSSAVTVFGAAVEGIKLACAKAK